MMTDRFEELVHKAAEAISQDWRRHRGLPVRANPLSEEWPTERDRIFRDARAALNGAADYGKGDRHCADCHRPIHVKLAMEERDWKRIQPEGPGSLCVTCMADRFDIIGAEPESVLVSFTSGPLAAVSAAETQLLFKALQGAIHALRSYQYGNAATDLARDVADAGERTLNLARIAGIGSET